MMRLQILGSNISILVSYEEVYENLKNVLKSPSYVTVNNVHTVVLAVKNRNYKEALNNSILSLPDGKPLSIIARLKGVRNISRIFGPSFMEKTIDWGQEDGLKHFFFGSSEKTLNEMIKNIKIRYPKALVAGAFSPPYKERFSDDENEYFLKLMNDSGADIFWIGLGAPKQELWIYNNYRKLKHGVMIGIGAGFDYLAGRIKHAPEWMKNLALEWLYRLIQEPSRLWKRYLVTNSLFIWYIFLDLTGIKRFDN
jgi:N-acetylglucosaminyldiphosphoundecaprenol N-acetyl-beta-D-mannosaminyltransferase